MFSNGADMMIVVGYLRSMFYYNLLFLRNLKSFISMFYITV